MPTVSNSFAFCRLYLPTLQCTQEAQARPATTPAPRVPASPHPASPHPASRHAASRAAQGFLASSLINNKR
jgi:hypothetical protein